MKIRRKEDRRQMMSEMMVCFNCCVTEQPPQRKKRRIDRAMIGLPTDFRHTGHIGSGDIENNVSSAHLNTVQTQMSTKGGYELASPVNVHLHVMDVQRAES